jgi:hypothetical protein
LGIAVPGWEKDWYIITEEMRSALVTATLLASSSNLTPKEIVLVIAGVIDRGGLSTTTARGNAWARALFFYGSLLSILPSHCFHPHRQPGEIYHITDGFLIWCIT